MNKEELRTLIRNTKEEKTLEALWELYELKFCNKPTLTYPLGTRTNIDPLKMTYGTINECHNELRNLAT